MAECFGAVPSDLLLLGHSDCTGLCERFVHLLSGEQRSECYTSEPTSICCHLCGNALKQTLLKAQSITLYPESAVGAYVMKVFDRLGIGEAMKAKIRPQPPGQIASAVAKGDAELAVFLTNLLAAPGVEIAGPFPGDLQQDLVFVGAVSADSTQADVAKAFLTYLKTPEAIAVFKSKGVTPG